MKEVPPEIDALMWSLAENGGPLAIEEFETRHTRYGPELARRIRMVAELREAGRATSRRPAFTPRTPRVTPASHGAVAAAAGLAILAVGVVAYVVASGGARTPTASVAAPPSPIPISRVTPTPTPPPRRNEPKSSPAPEAARPPEPTPDYLTPRDVRIEDTALTAAIRLVAAGGGLRVTVAPGFEDRQVTLDYRGLNTVDTLKAMGDEYGFSVMEEEDGHVLVLPTRDSSATPRIGG